MSFQVLLDAPNTILSTVQIAKLGDFKDKRYGEFSITEDDVNAWRSSLSSLPGGRAVIDEDHMADRTPRRTEASGWITDVRMQEGVPVADVEWTPKGKSAIEEKRYLFISPTYGNLKTESGDVVKNALLGAALTNRPFLNMQTLTLASAEAMTDSIRELDVSQGERDLAVKEGNALPDGSYPIRNNAQLHSAAILAASGHGDAAAAKKLIKRRAKELGVDLNSLPGMGDADADSQHSMALAPETLKLLELSDNADDAAIEAAILGKISDSTKALEAEVAEKETTITTLEQQVTSLSGEVKAWRDEVADNKFNTAFDKAMREGRVTDADRERSKHFYSLDAEATLEDLKSRPQLVRMQPSGWANDSTNPVALETPPGVDPQSFQLHGQIKSYMREKGLKPAEFPKVLDAYFNGEIQL